MGLHGLTNGPELALLGEPPERSISNTSLLVGRLSGLLRMQSVIKSATHSGHSSGTLQIAHALAQWSPSLGDQ